MQDFTKPLLFPMSGKQREYRKAQIEAEAAYPKRFNSRNDFKRFKIALLKLKAADIALTLPS